ncbi:LysR family transcriptional regulator [Rhodoplanes sp. Z2-YC6860]|uniref:LysR family transcriptional regulator n=1 Tax=Rhodoplanes sp. Z2-YC6860 TaxID=674703 RepID=UPI00078BF363|nr:LysR family transcriptional regulator [Rhodoplanes sp. Z2-YC6860]AMN44680.1 LysR family transcriptional regulator [Rhodoplanes sp. Z2-YC6860]
MDSSERIERRIGLHNLRVLKTVIEAGSMGKAASRLGTSQPAVSRAIAELEEAFGVRFLDRKSNGIQATAYGEALFKRGTAIFDELRQSVRDIQALLDPTVGDLTIGASIAIAEGFVCGVITSLLRRYPRLRFQVHATDTATTYQDLLSRKVDLVIAHLVRPPSEESMNVELLLQDPHVVVTGLKNPLARRRQMTLAQVWDESWVLPLSDQPYGSVVTEAFVAQGLTVPPVVVESTLPLRTSLLTTGKYITMVPRIVTQFPPKNGLLKVLPIDLPGTARPLAILTLSGRTLSPLANLFAANARAVVKLLRSKR